MLYENRSISFIKQVIPQIMMYPGICPSSPGSENFFPLYKKFIWGERPGPCKYKERVIYAFMGGINDQPHTTGDHETMLQFNIGIIDPVAANAPDQEDIFQNYINNLRFSLSNGRHFQLAYNLKPLTIDNVDHHNKTLFDLGVSNSMVSGGFQTRTIGGDKCKARTIEMVVSWQAYFANKIRVKTN